MQCVSLLNINISAFDCSYARDKKCTHLSSVKPNIMIILAKYSMLCLWSHIQSFIMMLSISINSLNFDEACALLWSGWGEVVCVRKRFGLMVQLLAGYRSGAVTTASCWHYHFPATQRETVRERQRRGGNAVDTGLWRIILIMLVHIPVYGEEKGPLIMR